MNRDEFIAEFRRIRDDREKPYLWSDEEIVTYLNDAVNEACERAYLIEDRTTDAVCLISLEAGEGSYLLHPSILHIKRLTFRGRPLRETSVEELDETRPGWELRTGEPGAFVREGQTRLRMVPTPTVDEDIALTVYRLPLVPVGDSREEPEIPAPYHPRLMSWVYRCALLKTDSETYNEKAALDQEAVFTRSFGERLDANVQRKHRDRAPPIIDCAW